MYEFLKSLSADNNWKFEYSRPDYQSLQNDIEPNEICLYADPVTIESKFSDAGNESVTYSGKFMLLLSSDVDEEYEEKYLKYVKPLIDESLQIIKDSFTCSEYQINMFRAIEVINLFDFNLDGVLVTYNILLVD